LNHGKRDDDCATTRTRRGSVTENMKHEIASRTIWVAQVDTHRMATALEIP